MSNGHHAWEAPGENERDIFAAELVGEAGSKGHNPTTPEMGNWVARAIRLRNPVAQAAGHSVSRIIGWLHGILRRIRGQTPAEQPILGSSLGGSATATAIGALEGTLASKSLDGTLKEAQILDAYATARQKNADAIKLSVETEKLRQEMAFERLERVIELCERLGAPVRLAHTPSGRLAITVGEGLIGEIPDISPVTEPMSFTLFSETQGPAPDDVGMDESAEPEAEGP